MLWIDRFSSPMIRRRRVALALLTLSGAMACADRSATDPHYAVTQHAATQQASTDIDPVPTKRPGGYPPNVSASPSSLMFGPQAPNTTSSAQTVTIVNTTTFQQTITVVTAGGPFTQTGNCLGASLAPGGSCTLSVAFVSTTGGGVSGSLSIGTDGQGDARTVPLNATPTPWASLTPTAIGYGSVAVGLITSGRVVKITNIGNAGSLVVSSLTLGGTNPDDFSIGADGCTGASLNPGGSCTAYVSFEPLAIGTRSATLSIASTAFGGPSLVSLSGSGKSGGGYIP